MSLVRSVLVSVAVAGMAMSGEVLAQAPAPEPAKEPSTAAKVEAKVEAKADEVAKWTTKEWNKAKVQWAKEKEKWAGCQKQSKDQGLTGRKSWSFLASCMTSAT
jgi:hypothetical protein